MKKSPPARERAPGPAPSCEAEASVWVHRVDISELDPYSHANHTAFIRWMEEGRERLLRGHGTSFLELAREGHRLVLANLTVDYKGSANWGDEIAVGTRVEKLGRSSVSFGHCMRARDDAEILRATVTMVFVDPEGKPAPIPDGFRRAFSEAEGDKPEPSR
jgi:acyl-CoA thioester hydrolase